MKQNRPKSGIYDYLERCGVLEAGTSEAIAAARKQYRREYKAAWRRSKRQQEKEITTSWAVSELKQVSIAAKRHKSSRYKFIKEATLAYINKTFIVPDIYAVREVAQLLSMNYCAIQELTDECAIPLQTGKTILELIYKLERKILPLLHHPKTLEELVREAIKICPEIKTQLWLLLNTIPAYDSQKP